ncbi:MAG: YfcC family protein [Alteromonadaceae bacterium]|nr:YfcC family protein [Alteromonadaceae bacterium]
MHRWIKNFTDGKIFKPIAVPNTYHTLDNKPQGVIDFFQSFIKGFYSAIEVILLVLVIGGLIGIVNATGAFNKGLAALSHVLKGREPLLIIFAFLFTCAGGTTFGMAEEVIAFLPIFIPIFLVAGYDVLVPLATLYLGAATGTLGSTINPFSVIIASNSAGINWTVGMNSRIVMLILASVIVLFYILRYAKRIKADPTQSLVYFAKQDHLTHFLKPSDSLVEKLDRKSSIILTLFVGTFSAMVYGVINLNWWFVEMTTIFFSGALFIAIVAGMPERKIVNSFISGAQDLLSVAIIIAMARGITVLMEDGLISDTILYHASLLVSGMPEWLFVNVMLLVNLGLGVIISSSSGLAVLTMPIFAPLADSVGIGRELIVNGYVFGFHLVQFISPTGLLLASLTLAKVPFNAWLKFIFPLLVMLLILSSAIITSSLYF